MYRVADIGNYIAEKGENGGVDRASAPEVMSVRKSWLSVGRNSGRNFSRSWTKHFWVTKINTHIMREWS